MKTLENLLPRLKNPTDFHAFLQTPAPHPEEAYQIAQTKIKRFALKPQKAAEGIEIRRHLIPGSDHNETRFEFEAYWQSPEEQTALGTLCPEQTKNLLNKMQKNRADDLTAEMS
jgi:hypothetical protein